MPSFTDIVERRTLSWISFCTVLIVAVVGSICGGVFTGIRYLKESRDFHCYISFEKPTREESVEDYCYRKYSREHNKEFPLAVYVVLLLDVPVGVVTVVYASYVYSRVVGKNMDGTHSLSVFSAYMVQLVVRSVILGVFLCLQWSVFSSIVFPADSACKTTASTEQPGSQNLTTGVANASTSAPWRIYYCENPHARTKSVPGWVLFVTNLLAFASSVWETKWFIYNFKDPGFRGDRKFCTEYLHIKFDNTSVDGARELPTVSVPPLATVDGSNDVESPTDSVSSSVTVTLEHLRERSQEKMDDRVMYGEWDFKEINDMGMRTFDSPVSSTRLRYVCKIENKLTGESTVVQPAQFDLFNDMAGLLTFVHHLISKKLRGKYRGVSPDQLYRFEIRREMKLVAESQLVQQYVRFNKGNNNWEVQVSFESDPELQEERYYDLRIKSSRCIQDGVPGPITFRVIECTLIDD